MRKVWPVVTVSILLTALAPASASAGPFYVWKLTPDGQPRLEIEHDQAVLRVCPPEQPCTPIPNTSGVYEPGETPVGTEFEVEYPGMAVQRSKPWQGQVTSTGTAGLTGELKVGGAITALPGTWTGGWGIESSSRTLHVCPTAAGTGCEGLESAISRGSPPGNGPAALSARVGGWFVFVVERRISPSQNQPLPPPYREGAPHPLPAPSRLVSVSVPSGPIVAPEVIPEGAPPIAPTLAPKVALRKRALRDGARRTVGTVTCATRCRVRFTVAGRTRTLSVVGTKRLSIVNGRKLRGRLRVTVTVDGKRLKTGRVRL